MRAAGLVIIVISCPIPACLFATLPDIPDPVALFSQYLGTLALILMAWAQIMATRTTGIEALMSPLDRVYVLHKWSGIVTMTATSITRRSSSAPVSASNASPPGSPIGRGTAQPPPADRPRSCGTTST